MYSLYETLQNLCDKKHITGYRLCKDCGISPSVMTDLKNGRKKSVSADYIVRFANYFGVSVQSLMGEENTANANGTEDDENIELLEELKNSPEKRMLLHAAKNVSSEQIKAVAEMLMRFKGES